MASQQKAPPPPPGKKPRQTLPVDEGDIIDVVVGADEERAHSSKRRVEHAPPREPGVPRTVAPSRAPAAPMTVASDQNVVEDEEGEAQRALRMDGDHGDGAAPRTEPGVAQDIGHADTARHDSEPAEGDVEGGGEGRAKTEADDHASTERTVNLRRPRS